MTRVMTPRDLYSRRLTIELRPIQRSSILILVHCFRHPQEWILGLSENGFEVLASSESNASQRATEGEGELDVSETSKRAYSCRSVPLTTVSVAVNRRTEYTPFPPRSAQS